MSLVPFFIAIIALLFLGVVCYLLASTGNRSGTEDIATSTTFAEVVPNGAGLKLANERSLPKIGTVRKFLTATQTTVVIGEKIYIQTTVFYVPEPIKG